MGITLSVITGLILLYYCWYKKNTFPELLITGGIFLLAAILLPNIVKFINVIIDGTKVIETDLPALINHFSYLVPATAVYVFLKKKCPAGFLSVISDILYVFILMFIFGVYVLGVGNANTNLWIVNGLFFATVLVILFKIGKNWGTQGRIALGVPFTYILNVIVTCVAFYILGFRHGIVLLESSYFLVLMLCLQIIFFWLAIGPDPFEANARKRKSYWINKTWIFVLMYLLIYVMYLMFTGQLSPEALQANGLKNTRQVQIHQLQKNGLMEELEELKMSFDTEMKQPKPSITKLDSISMIMDGVDAKIEKLDKERSETKLPGALDNGSGFVRTAMDKAAEVVEEGTSIIKDYSPFGSEDEKKKDSSSVQKKSDSVKIIKTIGQHPISTDKNGKSGWYQIETGANGKYNFISDDWQFIVTYHDGQVVNAWEAKNWPTKKLIKFKIHNLSKKSLTLTTS